MFLYFFYFWTATCDAESSTPRRRLIKRNYGCTRRDEGDVDGSARRRRCPFNATRITLLILLGVQKLEVVSAWILFVLVRLTWTRSCTFQDDHRGFRRQLEDKRPIVENNLLSGRQYIANEPPLSDTSDSEGEIVVFLLGSVCRVSVLFRGQWGRYYYYYSIFICTHIALADSFTCLSVLRIIALPLFLVYLKCKYFFCGIFVD